MPNHVKNELYFECGNNERISELMNTIKGEDTLFDFNKVIPMPKELDIESSSRGDNGLDAYKDYINYGIKPNVDEYDLALGKKYFENIVKFGHKTWYGWRKEHWGTKWNAYDVADLNNGVSFLTAWNAPFQVISKISEMFPDVRITHLFADEDIGWNCGRYFFVNGEPVEDADYIKEGTEEAIRFACNLWGYEYDEYLGESET